MAVRVSEENQEWNPASDFKPMLIAIFQADYADLQLDYLAKESEKEGTHVHPFALTNYLVLCHFILLQCLCLKSQIDPSVRPHS